jgi:magnesium-transporting ATPase (P-type)
VTKTWREVILGKAVIGTGEVQVAATSSCVAYRVLPEDEFLQWHCAYEAAQSAIDDQEEAIETTAARIEHDSLQILGATALEDKLQEGIPEAIEMLHQAGIKLWILTGDKLQTAIEIGERVYVSCDIFWTLLSPRLQLQIAIS